MLKYVLRNTVTADFPCPCGMSPALHRLLVVRGISDTEEAEAFLNPGVHSLHDPLQLHDMARAAARVRAAMDAGEAICVYGDYDVDGVCASAILSGWLREQGAQVEVYLPSRHSEGYGLNEHAVREIAQRAKLLVTVDCGVTSVALVALAKELGLDAIVTDHHEPGKALPDCPVVNPLLGGYPFAHLCGAGVAWKLVWALGGEDAAMPWVDVAALATVADVVPLTGENRAIVRMGLDAINAPKSRRPGVDALIDAAGLGEKRVTSTAVAFQLAPRLNAGGRLGSARRSLELVLAEDAARARQLAAELEAENAKRRSVELQILAEAEKQLEDFDFIAHRAIVLAGADWNPGVIGLAASRLVEKYHYPVVLLSDQGDRLTGSCRSIEGVDIHAALTGCAGVIERFGGHRQAAGLTLKPGMLAPFVEAMDAWLSENVAPQVYIPVQPYDAELDFTAVTPGFIAALEGMQPTGFGNPAPLFRAGAEVVEARAVGAEGAHLKLTLAQGGRRLPGIAFREGHRTGELGGRVDALFVPSMNTWMGRTEPQLEIRALAEADVFERLSSKLADEAVMQCDFLTEILYNKKIPPVSGDATEIDDAALLDWMSREPQGTLAVVADLASARKLTELLAPCAPDLAFGEWPSDARCFNAVCVCPSKGTLRGGYRRIALAGAPLECLPGDARGRACYLAGDAPWRRMLPDLDDMRAVYRALLALLRRPAWCQSMAQLSRMVAQEAGVNDLAAAAALLAMADMGLFEIDLGARPVAVRRTGLGRAEPGESAVWSAIQRWREAVGTP